MRRAVLPSALLTLIASQTSEAQQVTGDQAVSASQQSSAKSKLGPQSLGGELMFGKIGEDVFANLVLRLNFDRENWGVGFGVPLRLRIIDNDPQNDDDLGSVLRKEDWDEPADFLRVLRYVYVGDPSKTGPFYARLGELVGLSIGHGTIVHRYYNGFDLDRWRVGTNIAVNAGPFGADAVVGDLARIGDPSMAGLRLSLRPLPWLVGEEMPLADRFVIGATLMTDPRAPYMLAKTSSGTVKLNEDNHPIVADRQTLAIVGVDVGYELLRGDPISITPYIDFNKITNLEGGWGLHLGVLWGIHLPVLIDTFTVDLRTEYRRVAGDYAAPYFNTVHEIERYEYPPGSQTPKLLALEAGANRPGRNGVFFDLLAGLPSYIYVGGEYVDYDGGENDGTIRLSLEVPALEFIEFSAFYYRVNLTGLDDFFKLDDRSAVVAEAKIPLYYIFTLNLRWWRLWQANPDTGSYDATDDWSVGVGFAMPL
jgi:hypothetical protein